MSLKANHDLRIYTADAGVYLWQVAQAYGKSYTTLNNWLRKELCDKDKAEFRSIVDKIAGEK